MRANWESRSHPSKRQPQLPEDERPRWHLPDALRVGVLAGDEESMLRLEAHMMCCPQNRELLVSLAEDAVWVGYDSLGASVTCQQARNALLWYLEEHRPMGRAAVAHLNVCESCHDHLLEPARAVMSQEVDESAISALD